MRNDCATVRCRLIYLESCRCECVCVCMFVCVPVCSNGRGYISTWIKKSCIFHHMRNDCATVRCRLIYLESCRCECVCVYVFFVCLCVVIGGVIFRHELKRAVYSIHRMRNDCATVHAAASSMWNHAGVNVYVCVCMFMCLCVLTVGVIFRHDL